jgi:hypothetical protein
MCGPAVRDVSGVSVHGRFAAVVLLVAAAGVSSAGCGFGGSDTAEEAGSWRKAPAAPLSPREQALGIWTGREALVIGGSDAPPCPPGASCGRQDTPPLRDGAAFNPLTGSWRRIADAPVGFDFAEGAVVGRTVFVATPGSEARPGAPSAVLAYRVDRDRWRHLPSPPRRHYTLVAAGDRLVVYGRGGGRRDPPGYVLGRGGSWRALPPDPLPSTHPQSMAWTGRELVLFGSAYVGRRATKPPLARAAALRLGAGGWRRLPDSQTVLYGYHWVRVGSRLINPALGDGGEEYRWGRPHGGILDPERGVWSDLPNPPAAGPFEFGVGVLTRGRGHYFSSHGWVLDTTRDRWSEIPRLEPNRTHIGGRTVTSAGRKLFVFGGAKFDRNTSGGRLLNNAWIWSPPAPGD